MEAFIAAVALAVVIAPAFAQQPAPAPTTAGPARIYTDMGRNQCEQLLQAERVRSFRQQDRRCRGRSDRHATSRR